MKPWFLRPIPILWASALVITIVWGYNSVVNAGWICEGSATTRYCFWFAVQPAFMWLLIGLLVGVTYSKFSEAWADRNWNTIVQHSTRPAGDDPTETEP